MRILVVLRAILALLAVGALDVGAIACGGTSAQTKAVAHTASGKSLDPEDAYREEKLDIDRDQDAAHPDGDEKPLPPDMDNDGDNPTGKGRYDSDDRRMLSFGHPASSSDKARIEELVRRYYAVAAAEDGSKACSLIYSTFAEAIPEDYGTSPPGPAFARGTTCSAVVTKIFKHFHKEVMARLPKLKVLRVRTREREGVAFLSFGSLPDREIRVSREGHSWRILGMLDNELP